MDVWVAANPVHIAESDSTQLNAAENLTRFLVILQTDLTDVIQSQLETLISCRQVSVVSINLTCVLIEFYHVFQKSVAYNLNYNLEQLETMCKMFGTQHPDNRSFYMHE